MRFIIALALLRNHAQNRARRGLFLIHLAVRAAPLALLTAVVTPALAHHSFEAEVLGR